MIEEHDMMLWSIAIVLTIIFLLLLFLTLMRKIQFDAIHHNFLDLEDEFGGQVERHGFAVRPRYAGAFKGQNIAVSITTEKMKKERKYYIAVTMQTRSRKLFTIMSTDWLGRKELPPEQKRETLPIQNGKYLLEASDPEQLRSFDLSLIENILSQMPPFAYVLMGKTRMLLESTSVNIVNDTKLEAMRPLFEGMYRLKRMVD
jgi:hypothetical protein